MTTNEEWLKACLVDYFEECKNSADTDLKKAVRDWLSEKRIASSSKAPAPYQTFVGEDCPDYVIGGFVGQLLEYIPSTVNGSGLIGATAEGVHRGVKLFRG